MSSAARDLVFGAALAFVGGFVDAAGFIGLFGLFTAHVTGNFVLIGAELVGASGGVVAKLLALPAFVLAVALTRFVALGLERRGIAPLRWLLLLEAAVLAAVAALGTVFAPFGDADSPRAVLVALAGVAAMGVQNAIGRLTLGHLAATTVMTVNVTQAVLDALDGTARGRLRRTLPAIAAFAAGALAGALGVAVAAFLSLAVPTLIVAGLALAAGDEDAGRA